MKFGKSIRSEARNNRSLAFVNFKYLKRILKKCGVAFRSRSFDAAKEEDQQFCAMLESELRKVSESYWRELQQISGLQALITQKLPMLDVRPDPNTYTRMGFEQLQAHLQSLGGLSSGCPVSSSVKTSAALCEFCINLGKISALCKRLRRCVLWNAVAVVKILKKREKNRSSFAAATDCCHLDWQSPGEAAAQVLARQDWYCCNQLPKIVSIVDTTTDALMQRLTSKPPSRDQYQCPICLDVIVDPVSLRTCGHRFCWACLCMAYCEKPEGTLERCPCCRCAFPLHPEAFEIDGILSRFLRDFFPEDQSNRAKEQKENLRQHLEVVQRQQEQQQQQVVSAGEGEAIELSTPTTINTDVYGNDDEFDYPKTGNSNNRHHCCPDCVAVDYTGDSSSDESNPDLNGTVTSMPTTVTGPVDEILKNCSSLTTSTTCSSLTTSTTSVVDVSKFPLLPNRQAAQFNGPLIQSAAKWLNSTQDYEPGKATTSTVQQPNKKSKGHSCRHELNVKQGKPSDVDSLAFTSSGSAVADGLASGMSGTLLAHSSASSSSLLHLIPPHLLSPQFSSSVSTATTRTASSSSLFSTPTLSASIIDSVVSLLLCDSPQRSSLSSNPPSPCRASPGVSIEEARRRINHPGNPDVFSCLKDDLDSLRLPENAFESNPIPDASVAESQHAARGLGASPQTVNAFLPELMLPPLLVDQQRQHSARTAISPVITSNADWNLLVDSPSTEGCGGLLSSPLSRYYYEAIDDDDDRLEEEYLVQRAFLAR